MRTKKKSKKISTPLWNKLKNEDIIGETITYSPERNRIGLIVYFRTKGFYIFNGKNEAHLRPEHESALHRLLIELKVYHIGVL